MGRLLEFVDFDMETKLLQYAEGLTDPEVQAQLAQFRKDNVGHTPKGKGAPQKHLSYDSLQRYLRICGMNGREFFALNGLEIGYPALTEAGDSIMEELGFYADRIDPKALDRLISTTERLVPALITSPEMKRAQPTKRAMLLLTQWYKMTSRHKAPTSLMHSWKDKHYATSFPTRDIPKICDYLKVSPHWLMRMDHCCLCSQNERTEYFLDLIPFISEKSRNAVVRAMRMFAGEELVAEWRKVGKEC